MDSSEVTELQLEYIRKANQALEAVNLHWDFSSKHRAQVKSVSDWISYNDIFVEREYDDSLIAALQRSDEIKLLDIGANVGFFLLRAMILREQMNSDTTLVMHGVEACPKTYKDLCDRIETQLEVGDRLALHLGLAGQIAGKASFTNYDFSGWNTLYEKEGSAIAIEGEKLETEFLDLRPIFRELGVIDLLKVNAEGAELILFESYKDYLNKVHEIVFVGHPKKYDVGDCLKILSEAGFTKVERISKNWVYRAVRDS